MAVQGPHRNGRHLLLDAVGVERQIGPSRTYPPHPQRLKGSYSRREVTRRHVTGVHQETCHQLFWTGMSLYEWKSQKIEKEPRTQKSFHPKFICRREVKKTLSFPENICLSVSEFPSKPRRRPCHVPPSGLFGRLQYL